MAEVTPVSEAHASAFQQMYQQIFEAWLRQSLGNDKDWNRHKDKDDSQEQKSEIRITDGDKLVYGREGEKFVNELTPELIGQLGVMKETPVGEQVPGAASLKLEVEGKVVLQSDSEGKIVVNSLLERQGVVSDQRESDVKDVETQRQENTGTVKPPHVRSGGLEAVQRSLHELNDSPLKQFLQGYVNEMQTLQQQSAQHQQQIAELVRGRVEQPKELNWWQRMTGKAGQAVSALREQLGNIKAASSLKTLFHSQVEPSGRTYQAAGYTIARQGRSYTLSDAQGNPLMQFRSTPMGVRVEGDVQLKPEQYQEIALVREQLAQGEQPQGQFQPLGAQDANYFARVNRIAQALTQYAASTGQKKVQVDGELSYRWVATADGKARIDAKDGRGPLFVKAGGQFLSRMSERDLVHFEQALPVLQSKSAPAKTVGKSAKEQTEALSL
ncbi:MAG: hypothetical protein F6K21_02510 [Symploca sp. SIO2D2]|nr:hypothetical protein [Symploca sp. SIO2D2]